MPELLKRHLPGLHKLVVDGHADYETLYAAEAKLAHDASCRAHCKQRHILTRALDYAAANPGEVKKFESKRLEGIVISSYAIIFKKVNASLLSANHASDHIEEFRAQKQLEGVDAVRNVIVGYQEDDQTGQVAGVFLIFPNGPKNGQEYQLTGSDYVAEDTNTTPLFNEEHDVKEVEIFTRKGPGEVVPFKRIENNGL